MSVEVTRKTVNALIPDAELDFGSKFLVSAAGTEVPLVIEGAKKLMGGLWIGGTAILYDTKIVFKPNAMNQAIHAGDYTVEIPLTELRDVRVRFGLLTYIIDLVTDVGKLSIRCFCAKAFAQTIRDTKQSGVPINQSDVHQSG